jgi:hypothetical protein
LVLGHWFLVIGSWSLVIPKHSSLAPWVGETILAQLLKGFPAIRPFSFKQVARRLSSKLACCLIWKEKSDENLVWRMVPKEAEISA